MLTKIVCVAIATILYYRTEASFLQCSYSDSLESIDDLDSDEYPEKAGFICDSWPFYSGGFPDHDSSSSSSDSGDSSEDDDDDELFKLPATLSPDSDGDDFTGLSKSHCLDGRMNETNAFCNVIKIPYTKF